MRIEVKRSKVRWPSRRPQRWYARGVAANGEEVWRTSETYANKADVLHAVDLLNEAHILDVEGP